MSQGQQMMVVLGANIANFQSAMSTVQSSMQDTTRRVQNALNTTESNVSNSSSNMISSLKNLAKSLVAAFAVDKIIDFGKTMLDTTANIQALDSQYTQVMGSMKSDTDKYLSQMAKKWNKHPNELKNAFTQYYALLKGKGVKEEDAFKLSKQYLEETVDANAFANESMSDTTSRFVGAIKGEYDSWDTAMVNVSQTMLNDQAIKTYKKKWDDLTVAQQETLKATIAHQQHLSAGVFGQGIREADSYANNLSMVKNTWNELLARFGSPMLEVANGALKGLAGTLQDIDTKGISGVLKDLVPPSFKGIVDDAKRIIGDFKLALTSSDWGLAGSAIATALGEAIDAIKGIGQKLAQKAVTEFNSIDWAGIASQLQDGISGFGITLANMISTNLGTAMKNGDWSSVSTQLGTILGDALNSLLQNATEFSGKVGEFITSIFTGIDWATVGANAVVNIAGFIIGFVAALLDLGTWLKVIQQYWKPLLLAIIGLLFLPESWLGKIGLALAKIPFAGKILEWMWNGLTKIIAPLGSKIQEWLGVLGKNFINGWKRMFDGGTILGDWLGKLGQIWSGITGWLSRSLGNINTRIQVWADKAGSLLASPFKFLADKAGQFIGSVVNKVQSIWSAVSSIAGKVKSAMSNLFSGIRVPKISLTWGSKNFFGKDVSYPTGFNISWHKDGAIVKGTNGGTIVGVGESGGDEAILPLSNKSRMKPFAEAVASLMPQQNTYGENNGKDYIITVPIYLDSHEIARATYPHIDEMQSLNFNNQIRYTGGKL